MKFHEIVSVEISVRDFTQVYLTAVRLYAEHSQTEFECGAQFQ